MEAEHDIDPYRNAQDLFAKKRFAEALAIYEDLANAGDTQCQIHAGWMRHEGLGVASDKEKARNWFHRAASLGSKEGAFYYARAVASAGQYEEAIRWFQRAATQDYGPALLWLGLAHVRGIGMAADFEKGVAYLDRAAAVGNIFAKRELAILMTQGKFGFFNIPIGLACLIYAVISGVVLAILDAHSDKLRG